MAHHWTQEWYWFTDKWTKEAVETMIIQMVRLADDGVWVWTGDIVNATVMLKEHLMKELGKEFTTDEVTAGINKLLERHCVFNWLKNRNDFTWDSSNNCFKADHDAWLVAGQEDERTKWYSSNGDPFWYELGIIFEGINFKDAPNSTDELPGNGNDPGEEVKSTYDLDKFPNNFAARSPPPGPAYINLGDTPTKGSPWPRKFGSPSNYLSPFQSPGFQYISREEFESSGSGNKSKSKSRKKLFMSEPSPASSAGSAGSNTGDDGMMKNLSHMFEKIAGKKIKKSG